MNTIRYMYKIFEVIAQLSTVQNERISANYSILFVKIFGHHATLSIIFFFSFKDCPDGSQPSTCELLDDPCSNNTCSRYPGAACMADPCNNCRPSFYHDRTGTKLKCNGKLIPPKLLKNSPKITYADRCKNKMQHSWGCGTSVETRIRTLSSESLYFPIKRTV